MHSIKTKNNVTFISNSDASGEIHVVKDETRVTINFEDMQRFLDYCGFAIVEKRGNKQLSFADDVIDYNQFLECLKATLDKRIGYLFVANELIRGQRKKLEKNPIYDAVDGQIRTLAHSIGEDLKKKFGLNIQEIE